MIKFFKGTYATVSGQIDVNLPNNIVFVTDRNTLYMGGAEYGKDQFSAVASSDLATTSAKVSVGTVIFDKDNGILYQKTGAETLTTIQNVPQNIADLKAEISATISGAFGAGDYVVVSKAGKIEKTDFKLDDTAGTLALTGDTLSTTLVNAETLKTQIANVNAAAATLSGNNGITAVKGLATADGTLWTLDVDIDTTSAAPFKFTDGKLDLNGLGLVKLAQATDTTYAASYQLQNAQGHVFGDTINIAKDQFLKSASYVAGTVTEEGDNQSYTSGSGADADRFLKLTFTQADGTDKDVYINVNELFDSYSDGDGITVDNATNTIAINIDNATESFLSVTSSGLKVTGIADAISTAIQGLSSDAGTANQYVTAIGVTAGGALSAATAQISAGQVAFDPANTESLTATTVQAAIDELAADVAGGFGSLSATQVGSATQYITSISQTSGIITATAEDLTADKVAYSTTFGGETPTNVSGALKKIEGVISGMDYTQTATGTTPSNGTTNALKFVNTVGEVDGIISATTLDLTAANVEASGITAVTTGTATDGSDVRVAIESGSQDHVNDQFSNILADFLSFHDGTGKVI